MRTPLFASLLLIFFLTACAVPNAVLPTATLTPIPPTATLEPSPTATQPAPTEGVGAPPAEAINIASMDDFDRAWFDEEGKTVKVTDLYGAGEATITVAEIKKSAEGQVLEYQELFTLDQESFSNGPVTYNRLNLQRLTVERMSRVKVDITDNTKVADGEWCVLQLGTLINGKKVSFEIIARGNFYKEKLAAEIFNEWNPGETINSLLISYYPGGGVTMDEIDNYVINKEGLSEEELQIVRFIFLGRGSVAVSKQDIMSTIMQGGILGGDMVGVSSID